MLATTLGVEFDSNQAWEEREQIYKSSGHIFKTTHVVQSAEGNKDGQWTTVIAAAVLIIEENHLPHVNVQSTHQPQTQPQNVPQNPV